MKIFLIPGLVLFGLVVACQKQSAPLALNASPPGATPAPSATREEPLHELTPKQFRETWMAFTKDGRYRMAQTKEVAGMPYHGGFFNDVLVIVVDQTLNDNSRLKLAYFRQSEHKGREYNLYWVDHNFNLAASRLGNASSVLYIYEGGEPPTRMAPLEWDAKRRRFTCLAT